MKGLRVWVRELLSLPTILIVVGKETLRDSPVQLTTLLFDTLVRLACHSGIVL